MFESANLDLYLSRIGYTGDLTVNWNTLNAIAFAHATSIPFENLDVLAGIPISLELDQVYDKLVTRKRGGYCFEQNNLLGWALGEVGFVVQYLSARVWYNITDGQTPPRTHVFLRVELDGVPWLVDCGVGGSTPTSPMRLDRIGMDQELPFETRRIAALESKLVPTFMHQIRHEDHWRNVYEFTGETMPKIDQEMGNWWTSQHPESKFRKNLIVAKANRDGTRFSVVNREAIHRSTVSVLERVEIGSWEHLVGLLQTRFQLNLRHDDKLGHMF